jgi:uncharacterized phiE125 gp8 family phage protein
MWYPATVTSAGTAPILLADAKRQLRVATSDDDTLIQGMLDAAMAQAEAYCGIRIGQPTLSLKCDSFEDFARIPEAPIRSVTSIIYVDTAGDTHTLSTDVYEARLEGLAPAIVLKYGKQWPATRMGSRITVVVDAGYASLPANIKSAVLLLLSKLYPLAKADILKRGETVDGVGATQWGGSVEVTATISDVAHGLLEPYRNWPLR